MEQLTKTELVNKVREQLLKLETFNKLFDEGDWTIAAEIAVKIRVLFHNTHLSKSLYSQLKLHDVSFVDTSSGYNSRNLLTHLGLLLIEARITKDGLQSKVVIKKDLGEKRLVDFDNWWNNRIVVSDKYHKTFTRRRLTLELANADGGAHVDEQLKEDYWKLTRKNSIDWFIEDPFGRPIPIENPVPLCVRQISHEILLTFGKLDVNRESKLFE